MDAHQAAATQIEIKGAQWCDMFTQMDGKPLKQPLSSEYSTIVDIKRCLTPHRLSLVETVNWRLFFCHGPAGATKKIFQSCLKL
ncbi:hypothetical protein BS78_03G075000 [Paspalum vaginatum]|nr:hypothetical protein BS78_03G075000 [Paspalum vaginatum]